MEKEAKTTADAMMELRVQVEQQEEMNIQQVQGPRASHSAQPATPRCPQ